MGKNLGRLRRPAAGLGALRREVLDARDDGHGPEHRAQRRVGAGASRSRPATSASPGTPTAGSSRCSARPCWASRRALRGRAGRGEDRRRASDDRRDLDVDDLRKLVDDSRGSSSSTPAARSRRSRASRWTWRSRRRLQVVERQARHRLPAPEQDPDDLGTAVNIVAMVFGNLGEDSGTGVAFTRDPATGEKGVYGDYLANAQGEDVVAGIRNTLSLARPRGSRPAVLRRACAPSWTRSRATTATCATSSSRSSTASSGCCRPGSASAPRPPRSGSRRSWSTRASSTWTRRSSA